MTQSTVLRSMEYRIPLDFIGDGKAINAYGGKLDAWSFIETDGLDWFYSFRQRAIDSIGNHYFPIYRMADGEYRFLMGRRFNRYRRPLLKECLSYSVDKLGLRNENKWSTSWGESYSPESSNMLKAKYIKDVREISRQGCLAMYINNNGLNAFVEYNNVLVSYLEKQHILLHPQNYVPFHFPCQLLTAKDWHPFYKGRDILIATGLTETKKKKIERTLKMLSVNSVQFLEISANQSMNDVVDISNVKPVDVCFVGAGIGASNILLQLESLQTLTLDIGGLINCFERPSSSVHGGTFSLFNMRVLD